MVEVRRYSSRHLELKFILPIEKEKVYEKEVSYYIFTPEQLFLHEGTTSISSLRHKFKSFGRYASPELTFDQLIDVKNEFSPLTTLEKYVSQLVNRGVHLEFSETEFIHEAQAVVNSLAHQLRVFYDLASSILDDENVDQFHVLIKDWKVKQKVIENRFLQMAESLKIAKLVNTSYLTSIYWADEASSLESEYYAIQILLKCRHNEKLSSLSNILLKIIYYEQNRRREMGYVSEKNGREKLSFRREILNKWSKSVLILKPFVSKRPKRITEFVAGLAASLAMAFTLIATFFAQSVFANDTIRWELLLIIIYVFKDRIKEGIKRFFSLIQPKLMPDKICYYISPRTGNNVCRCNDRLVYIPVNKVPNKIKKIRKKHSNNPFQKMMGEETVVKNSHYLKVYPQSKACDKDKNPWIKEFALVDVIRIDDWLKEMIDDVVEYENDETLVSNANYHLHLIVEEKKDDTTAYSHFLIVIDVTGILYVKNLKDDSYIYNYEFLKELEHNISIQKEKDRMKKLKKLMKKGKKTEKKILKKE